MSKKDFTYDLMFGKPIEFDTGVMVKVPTVEEVVETPNFNLHTMVFTLTTRELFQTLRDLEELERKYPSLWVIMHDEEMDHQIGEFFSPGKSLSMIFMEALHFWTGLELEGDGGFQKHINGKFVHIASEWVIDYEVFREFGDLVKLITTYTPPESLPPRITSDARHAAWISILKGRQREAEKNSITWADKILILSISTESLIDPREIAQMSIYMFYRLTSGLEKKEAYQTKLMYQLSPKYDSGKDKLRHWHETIKQV